MTLVLEGRGLVKTFRGGDGGEIRVLGGVDVSVRRGEMIAVVGASGAGKSTLLHVLGALERPSAGTVLVREVSLEGKSDESLAAIRNRDIGFVFQFHHLLREFTAIENVMMPLRIGGADPARALARAADLLDRVGLSARLTHRPAALSGGEQQRVAVARALSTAPAVLLADEPSGNLDHASSERLHDLLAEIVRDVDVGMVVVTHNRSLAARADRVLLLEDGRLSETDVEEGVA